MPKSKQPANYGVLSELERETILRKFFLRRILKVILYQNKNIFREIIKRRDTEKKRLES